MLLKLIIAAIVLLVPIIWLAQVLGKRKMERRKAEVAEIMRKHREQVKRSVNPATETYLEKTGPRYSEHFDGKRIATVDTHQKSTNPSLLGPGWLPKSQHRPPLENRYPGSLELMIRYTSHGQRVERKISVSGLGKYGNCYYIVGFCHLRNGIRHFKLQRFRGCIDLSTGQVITKVKDHILQFNPVVEDLTAEYQSLGNGDD